MTLHRFLKVFVALVVSIQCQRAVSQVVDSVGYMEISLTQISIDQGLSQGMINDLAVDKTGFLWAATKEGLNRFDGTGFKVFRNKIDDTTSLADNFIYNILADQQSGKLWITTQANGLDLFDPTTETFQHFKYDSLNPKSISSNELGILLQDEQGNVLVETLDEEGFAVITKEKAANGTVYTFKPVSEMYPALKKFKTGKDWTKHLVFALNAIWYYDFKDSIYRISGDLTSDKARIDSYYITPRQFKGGKDATVFITSPKRDKIYITDNEQGLLKYSEELNKFVPYLSIPKPHRFGFKQFIDSKNRLWTWTPDHDIIRIDLDRREYVRISPKWNLLKGLATNHTGIALEDENGNLWMGTGGNGILQIKRTIDQFKLVPSNQVMFDNSIRLFRIETPLQKGLYSDALRNKWIDLRQRLKIETDGLRLSDSNCHLSMDKNGNFWIGGYDLDKRVEYLFKIDTSDAQLEKITSKHHDNSEWFAMPVFLGKENTIWFGEKFSSTGVNLYNYNPELDTLIVYPIPAKKKKVEYRLISDWYQNDEGNWWLATTQGLFFLHTETKEWRTFQYESDNETSLSFDVCLSVHPDPNEPDKFLWVGTEGGGLNKLNLVTEEFTRYTTENGLPNNVVYGILADNHNHFWISTNNGLCQFNPSTEDVVNYSTEDGLPGNEFNRYECSQSQTGEFYFGGTRGQLHFNPEDFYAEKKSSKLIINDLLLFNQPVTYTEKSEATDDFVLAKPIQDLNHITFEPEHDMITFSFAVMDLTSPSKNQFKYRLIGLQENWILSGTKNEATFTNLAPGDYTLQVLGSNSRNAWTEQPTTLKITVLSPWYATTWFRALLLFLFASVLYGLYRQRVNQLLREEKMRNRIAQDLHDEIGSTLSSISLFSTVLEKTLQSNPEKAKPILQRITESCNQMMESMNDMVWTIKADNDNFRDVVNRMRSFAVNMTEPKNINLIFQSDEKTENLTLDMETRKNIYLLFKEAINNAVKYANCTEIQVSVSVKNSVLELNIVDNGDGFDVDSTAQNKTSLGGNGIKGMHTRAKEINAEFNINSVKNSGTTLIMRLEI